MYFFHGLNYIFFLVTGDRLYFSSLNPLNVYPTFIHLIYLHLSVLISDLADLLETIHIMLQLMEKLQARGALRVWWTLSQLLASIGFELFKVKMDNIMLNQLLLCFPLGREKDKKRQKKEGKK